MQRFQRHIALALPAAVVLALAACKDGSTMRDNTPSTATRMTPPPSANAPEVENIASQSELEKQAAQQINEKNADAEFEKLQKEIEGDH